MEIDQSDKSENDADRIPFVVQLTIVAAFVCFISSLRDIAWIGQYMFEGQLLQLDNTFLFRRTVNILLIIPYGIVIWGFLKRVNWSRFAAALVALVFLAFMLHGLSHIHGKPPEYKMGAFLACLLPIWFLYTLRTPKISKYFEKEPLEKILDIVR